MKTSKFLIQPPLLKYNLSYLGSQGTSLIELMIGLLIFSTVSVLMSSMMSQIQNQFSTMSVKVQQQTELEEMGIILRRYLSQAVELKLVGSTAAVTAGTASNLDGRVFNYDLDGTAWNLPQATDALPDVDPVALFFIDEQASDLPDIPVPAGPVAAVEAAAANRFLPVAIMVQRPTAQGADSSKYGLVALQVGNTTQTVMTGVNPSYRFTNIVDFKILNVLTEQYPPPPAAGTLKVKSLTVVITKRYFNTVDVNNYRWCPPNKTTSAIPECDLGINYTDLTKAVDITIRNNVLGPSFEQRRFKSTGTTSWFDPIPKRMYDGTYFYRTRFPTGALKR